MEPSRSLAWFLGLVLTLAAWPALADEPPFLPLAKGAFWVYEGDVSWVAPNPATGQNQVDQKHLTWRSEVTDVAESSGSPDKAFLLHGFPTELADYDSGTQPQDRILLLLGTDYYEIIDKATDTFQKIKAASGIFEQEFDDIDKAELFLSTPLALGKCYGGSPGNYLQRRYCWVVASVTPFDLSQVKGAPQLKNPLCYAITCDTSPDHSEMDIVPGLGIVKFIYSHHGTTMETNVHLTEFGRGP
jgi:hypothetical protein